MRRRCFGLVTAVVAVLVASACGGAPPAQGAQPAALAADTTHLAQLVGWYRFPDLGPALLTWGAETDLGLMIVRDTMLRVELTATAARADSFSNPRRTGAVTFTRREDGGAAALHWFDGRIMRTARRVDGEYRPHAITYTASDGVTLHATVFVPRSPGPHSGVVMVHGSGASSRDNAWYMTLVDAMASRGLVVLLPDKRGSGASGGDWRTADLSLLVNDAVAGLRALQGRAEVDSASVGLVGVSQGGRVAAMAPVTAPDVAFVVSLSAAAVPLDEQLRHEVTQDLRRSAWPAFLHPLVRSISLRTRIGQRDWWKRNGRLDPIESWRSHAAPGLVVYGAEDESDNVPVRRSIARLAELDRGGLTVRVFPGSGHALYAPGTMRIRQDLLALLPEWIDSVATPGMRESSSGGAISLPTPIDWPAVEAAVDSVVRATMEANRIPGAAVVFVERDTVRILKGYGVADTVSGTPVDPARTIFRIGSISKAVTALGLLRLVDQGRIGLDDSVGPHLPSSIGSLGKFAESVRVSHLLGHTGGFDQIGLRRQVDGPGVRPSLEEFLARELVQVRPPGSVGVYDTYGITLAGHLIERLTGESYADYMARRVFAPLGMRDTWVETPAAERHRLATGYGLEDGALEAQPYEWYVTTPASSIDATTADMGRLLLAMLGGGANRHGRLLGDAVMARVLGETQTRYAQDMAAFSWGFWEESRAGYRALHHGGIMRGYSSELYLVPELRVGFYVVYNRDPETGPNPLLRERLVDLLYERILPNRGAEVARAPASPEPVPTAQFAGAYGGTLGCFTCQEGEGWGVNTVRFTAAEPGVLALGNRRTLAIDSTGFRGEATGALLRFLRDSAGRVRYMVQGTNSFARLDEHLLAEVLGSDWRSRPPAPLVALTHRANERWDDAAAAYRSLSTRHTANGAYPFYQGFSLLHAGRFAEAIPAFEEALRRRKWMAWSQYYVAAGHAAMHDTTAAIAALRKAVELGFSDRNLLMMEPWWEPLRAHTEWQAITDRLR